MDPQDVLRRFQHDDRLQSLADQLSSSSSGIFCLTGLAGSAAAMVATVLWKNTSFNHVFILNDKEEAAYFHNDVEQISHALDVFFFPDSFKSPRRFDHVQKSHIMLRTEALMHFSEPVARKKILVTYPEALLEKVAPPEQYTRHAIALEVGQRLQVETLIEQLIGLGFERTDFVYEPGQVAIRGGIVDIYSFGNEKPYRIELFGDEIESIRIFDPETQLSERKIKHVTLLPNLENPQLARERVSLITFLSAPTIWWVKDLQFLQDALRQHEHLIAESLQQPIHAVMDEESGKTLVFERNDFCQAENCMQQLFQHHLIEFGKRQGHPKATQVFTFQMEEQPSFNRQFELLIDNLKQYDQKKYALLLAAENPRQIQRLQAIFDDLQAGIVLTPLTVNLSKGFVDHDHQLVCYTDHQIFERYHKYHIRQAYSKNKALTLKALKELQPGDYVVHMDHGIGIFSGLQKIEVNGHVQEAIRIIYKDNDILYVNINSLHKISKYVGKEGTTPRIHKLGSDTWQKLKEKTKSKVKDIAADLIRLYAERKAKKGFAHSPDTYLQHELEASFMYEDTPDQSKATEDVKRDMESPEPMDRLICGDVGFGKTEVAIRAAFKTVVDGKQAAVLVPTTILAYQHYKTFSDRLQNFPCTVDYINRFKSAKERKETLQKLKEGKIDIIIGTHALLGKDVEFKDLGLLIIDEEQKFGVAAKEKIRQLKTNVDTLTMTATPIPRTLQFSLMGARDLSIINTPPPNRQPIETEIIQFDEHVIRDAIYYEIERGGQVFFIHNRVQNIGEIKNLIQSLCPDLSIAVAHGKMEGHQLEQVILDFMNRKYDVLVCTNIVESGLDMPNVNTIIIHNAHQFGLSDLHQLRGRVGRSNKKAFCYLIAPPLSSLPADSRKRLQAIEQFTDLGSGFQIALRDLDIRGAGNLLGAEQSGFMAEMGIDMYQKILDEAVRELKQHEFRDLFKDQMEREADYVSDCTIDTDLEILIPDDYVENIAERLNLYQELNQIETDEKLQAFAHQLEDRFGPLPQPVMDLLKAMRCRWMGVKAGFEKMILKEGKLRCYFNSNPDSPYFESPTFQRILQFVQQEMHQARLKQIGKNFMLVIDHMQSIDELENLLTRMMRFIHPDEYASQMEKTKPATSQ
ncbi:transcription-repair coupling factor (superfamily II helicase) [Thermoflavifilum thermophilum]|uniref:Transcription-repair-coupling factor n=1 Tax=Thermoflavifilum thermophilum TaxID=1393122 RepID=A0A1I7N8G5_9BACT|nr:transcription-repair coupling factor (superfamily II helicase) [Thermoflavifilum thermophilum]